MKKRVPPRTARGAVLVHEIRRVEISLEEWKRGDAQRKKRLGLFAWDEVEGLPFPGVFTVHFDYFATGEGQTVGVLVCCAHEAKELRRIADEDFGDYFASGAEIAKGVRIPPIANALVSAAMRKRLVSAAAPGAGELAAMVHYHAVMHLNYS